MNQNKYKKSVMDSLGLQTEAEFEECEAIRYGKKPIPEWIHGYMIAKNYGVSLDVFADAVGEYIKWKRNQLEKESK